MPLARLAESQLATLNAHLETHSAEEIIRWAHGVFGRRVAILSAMQQAGCVICEMVASLGLQRDIDVLFVDTGVNFPETLETIGRMRARYGLNIISLHPERTMEEQCREEGVLYLTKAGQERCCDLRKLKPLKQIVGHYDALIGSLRREEGSKRGVIPVVAVDDEMNLLRIHPIFAMSRRQMMARIEEREVVTNPLHQQGYPTVSCNRCTTPVVEGEEERAGRWRHLAGQTEYCHINPTDRTGEKERAIELPDFLVAKLVG